MLADVAADTRSNKAVFYTDIKRNMQCDFLLDHVTVVLDLQGQRRKMTCGNW